MVTRARIIKVISEKEVQIEVPMFGLIEEGEGEEQVNELPNARICTTPGCSPNYKKDDIVLICIEDNDLSNPMIMGRLIPDDKTIGTSNAEFDTLEVNKDTTLSKNTTIGEVKPEHIEQLVGVTHNIQLQFDTNTNQKIEAMNWMAEQFNNIIF